MDELAHLYPHGVFLRRHALTAGYDDRALQRALAAGGIVRVRHGAYVDRRAWAAADDLARYVLRAHAVALVHTPQFGISHVSGAAMHGMRVWGADLSRIHLTRPLEAVGRRHRNVAYHRGSVVDAVNIAGTPVVSAVSAAFGAACMLSVEAGMVLLDSAYDLGLVERDELVDQYARHRGWPGTARLQISLRLAQPGSQSVGESRMRYLFWAHGLPRPELQYVVRDGSGVVGVSDFAWPEHHVLGEFDGRIKYDRLLRPGETPADAVVREKLREDRMRELTGWKFIRFVWSDLAVPDRTAERLGRILRSR